MGDLNDNFRVKLKGVFKDAKLKFAECLEEAKQQGEVSANLDVLKASDFILSSFEGALLQMKVSKTTVHRDVFSRMIFEKVLRGRD